MHTCMYACECVCVCVQLLKKLIHWTEIRLGKQKRESMSESGIAITFSESLVKFLYVRRMGERPQFLPKHL